MKEFASIRIITSEYGVSFAVARFFLKDSQSTFYVSSAVTVVIQHFKLNEVSKILSLVFFAIYPEKYQPKLQIMI